MPRINRNRVVTRLVSDFRALNTITGRADIFIYLFGRPAVLLRVSRYKATVRQLTDLVKLLSIYSLISGIVFRVYTL